MDLRMILRRFCSFAEYDAYIRGERLRNITDHAKEGRATKSVGFCFFTGNSITGWGASAEWAC